MTDEEMKKIIEDAGYTVLKKEEDKFVLETPNNRNSDWEMLHGEEYTVEVYTDFFYKNKFSVFMRGAYIQLVEVSFNNPQDVKENK